MYIQLEDKDYKVIAKSIADNIKDEGVLCVDIDGMEFKVEFSKTAEGHYENNELTYALDFVIDCLHVGVYCIYSGDFDVHFEESDIEGYARDFLKEKMV